ncbi:tRNA (N6-isopentenyl adenosine(37)-C2)-methylthiotransferase MiaB [Calditrichota bacterium]
MQNHCRETGRIYIETYGCQMNKADSEVVMALLEEHGFCRASSADDAGIILINTCIVREHAQEKAVANISHYKRYKNNENNVRVGVLGCMASGAGEMLAERLPFLDWILGPDAYRSLPELIAEANHEMPIIRMHGIEDELYDEIGPSRREGINAWVVINRGCSNHCTYCVVPGARGEERYRPAKSIFKEVEEAVNDGYPQVTLLGQNVNSWSDTNLDFADLLKSVADTPGLKRVRFITSHPKDCSEKLLVTMSTSDVICPELHLPVQSGSNRILKLMGRKYTREHYLDLAGKALDMIPGLLLSTDIIVGFPGESLNDYFQTEELARMIEYDDAYVYRYSERPGTPAARMIDDVPEDVKIERLQKIGAIIRRSGRKKRQDLVGKTLLVLVEGASAKSPDERMGRTQAGHIVVFPGDVAAGEEVYVNLKNLSGYTLIGERI